MRSINKVLAPLIVLIQGAYALFVILEIVHNSTYFGLGLLASTIVVASLLF